MPSLTLLILIFLVALVYASVGQGGASGYLAAMTLLEYAPAFMASSALILNLFVAGTAWLMFRRAGHGSRELLWPFVAGSVPAALLGGWLPVSPRTYGGLLALALVVAAVRLWLPAAQPPRRLNPPTRLAAGLIGAAIGLVSGIVGVGGGIFLSPLLILLGWADPKRSAAASAGFIVVNSAAGLAGRVAAGRLLIGTCWPLIGAAFLGGLVGSRLGAHRFSGLWMRRLLAGVLAVAAGKLAVAHG
ncbi:MAG: sulfite exporter TauE/SafE family protein [Candidatus Omnitrophica bacterium]|nr:sulfite exporter TauE/SafE family protein [Candidatus Omnitrophota bacterium]